MYWVIFLWVISLMCSGYFIFSSVFVLVMNADLKSDYINPIEMASKVNTLWWPDFIIFSILSLLYFFSGYWVVLLLHIPILAMNIYGIVTKTHLVDPSTILQRNEASQHRNKTFAKLGFAIVSFFLYLYMLITEAIAMKGAREPNQN
eukprot:TRINITY_DN5951_c0_g1_i1.p1 TRINITY_DN5951_c0_g1~~TRINITY_DN5951_c0_g1_i1.p1  ORF type:complete len:154 (+),score=24.29 TRINITY_DN5951_c0_g1_i1:23-463(+)